MLFGQRRKTSRIINDLHSACQDKPLPEERILELIQEYPLAVEIRGNDGWLPIHRIARRQPSKKLVLAFLKATPASKDALKEWTGDGITDLGARLPIHLACQFGAPLPTVKLMVSCLRESLNFACLDHNMTPLDYAYQAQEHDAFQETEHVIQWLESSIPASQRRPRVSRPISDVAGIPNGNTSAADLPIHTPDTTTEGSIDDDIQSQDPTQSALTLPPKRTDTGTTAATGGSHSMMTSQRQSRADSRGIDLMSASKNRADPANPSLPSQPSAEQSVPASSVLLPSTVFDHPSVDSRASSQADISSFTSADQRCSTDLHNGATRGLPSSVGRQDSTENSIDASAISSVSSIPVEQISTSRLPATSEISTASAAMGSFTIPSFSNPRAKTKDYRLNPVKKAKLEKYSRKLLEEASKVAPSVTEIQRILKKCPDSIFVRTDYAAYTALHYACESGAPLAVIDCLVRAWPNSLMEATSQGHHLPLHLCFPSSTQGRQVTLDVVQFLIQCYPTALKTCATGGMLPLHCACFYGASTQVIAEVLRCSKEVGVSGQRTGDNRTCLDLLLHSAYPAAGVDEEAVHLFQNNV